MRLQHAPFSSIKEGGKRIEMRLYDEKRSLINEGDSIEFTDVATGETLVCRVVHLYCYASFEDLYAHHDKISIGYKESEEANPLFQELRKNLKNLMLVCLNLPRQRLKLTH